MSLFFFIKTALIAGWFDCRLDSGICQTRGMRSYGSSLQESEILYETYRIDTPVVLVSALQW